MEVASRSKMIGGFSRATPPDWDEVPPENSPTCHRFHHKSLRTVAGDRLIQAASVPEPAAMACNLWAMAAEAFRALGVIFPTRIIKR